MEKIGPTLRFCRSGLTSAAQIGVKMIWWWSKETARKWGLQFSESHQLLSGAMAPGFPSAFLSHTLPGHFHLPLLSHTKDVSEIPSSFSSHTRKGILLSFIKTGAKQQNQKVKPPALTLCLFNFIFFPTFLKNNLLLKILKIIFTYTSNIYVYFFEKNVTHYNICI